MKYLNGIAWIVTVVVVAATIAYWDEIQWCWKNRATIKTAADVGSGIEQLKGLLQ